MLYITSDLHFFHDREFIWGPRGFQSEKEMREAYLGEWRAKVADDDDIYVLGDFCMGKDPDRVRELVSSLPGRIHLIRGNHDTDAKVAIYESLPNVVEIAYATVITYKKRQYYLSHYKTETSNLETNPWNCVVNLHGHIHTKQVFAEDKPYNINVSVDAQGGVFLTLAQVQEMFRAKVEECKKYL